MGLQMHVVHVVRLSRGKGVPRSIIDIPVPMPNYPVSAIGRGSCSLESLGLPGRSIYGKFPRNGAHQHLTPPLTSFLSLLSMVQRRAFKFFFALTGPSWWSPLIYGT